KLNWWDCRVQSQCTDIRDELAKLQVTSADCTEDKLQSFKKELRDLHEKILGITKKIDPTIKSAPESLMERMLSHTLWTHFGQCYKDGLIKIKPDGCATTYCEDTLETLDNLKINDEDCNEHFSVLHPEHPATAEFPFETDLIKKRLAAYKTKCEDAGFLPIMTVYGRAVTKKEAEFAQQCKEAGEKLQEKISSLKIKASDCSKESYEALRKEVHSFEQQMDKLYEVTKNDPNSIENPSLVLKNMWVALDRHIVNCEKRHLFKHH
ncbi:MAG: hypothetical protein LUC43_07640, partial [Burkholderiales bacterium]|nr:hypothetical protein [Burkholderiales bacterium]